MGGCVNAAVADAAAAPDSADPADAPAHAAGENYYPAAAAAAPAVLVSDHQCVIAVPVL